jgi:hypothetical protein
VSDIQLTFIYTGWSYIHTLPNLRKGGNMVPGVKATYGCTAPGHPETYRIALPVGKSDQGEWQVERGSDISLIYPERVFVYARDDHGKSIPDRERIYVALLAAGIRAEGFWNLVEIHRGYDRGEPLWDYGLRSHTDIGPSWGDVEPRIRAMEGRLSDGKWQVDSWGGGRIPSLTAFFTER